MLTEDLCILTSASYAGPVMWDTPALGGSSGR